MKIGYPCINNSIKCTSNRTFRLASYSKERFHQTVLENLTCLKEILNWNLKNNILFFRIGSGLIPFASHSICTEAWQKIYQKEFKEIGLFIKKNKMRISVHPDQFVLLNAEKKEIVENSIKELLYHADILDLMELSAEAKIQIHVGGVYGDKEKAMARFVQNYKKLPLRIKKRLVIENDHRLYSLKDVLVIHEKTKVPILFDVFHHQCLNNKESVFEALSLASQTWQKKDGLLMVDYSSQEPNSILGKHSQEIDLKDFQKFLAQKGNLDFDIMLEIKDKEKSTLKALKIIK